MNSVTDVLNSCMEGCNRLFENNSSFCSLQDRFSFLREAALECHQKCFYRGVVYQLTSNALSSHLERSVGLLATMGLGIYLVYSAWEANKKKNGFNAQLQGKMQPHDMRISTGRNKEGNIFQSVARYQPVPEPGTKILFDKVVHLRGTPEKKLIESKRDGYRSQRNYMIGAAVICFSLIALRLWKGNYTLPYNRIP